MTRSDLATRIVDQIEYMLYLLRIESTVLCSTGSIGKVRPNGRAAKLGIQWMGEVTIDGIDYTVGSRVGVADLGRILIEDHRDEPDQPVDFLVVPKPVRKSSLTD